MPSETSLGDTTTGDEEIQENEIQENENAFQHLCKQLFRKEIVRPPPTFTSGDDIQIHVKKVEEYIRMTDTKSSEDKVHILIDSFSDEIQKEIKMSKDFREKGQDFQFVKDLVLNLYKAKVARLSCFLRLLELKQTSQQSVEEFARSIKIHAYDLIYDKSTDDREALMIESFINGLKYKNLSVALKLFKPKTLEDAVKMIKKEEKSIKHEESADTINCPMNWKQKVEELQQEVKRLKQSLFDLQRNLNVSKIRSSSNNRPQRNYAQAVKYNMPQKRNVSGQYAVRSMQNPRIIVCKNCDLPGHYASMCRQRKRCFICKSFNHISRFCPNKQVNLVVSEEDINIDGSSRTCSLDTSKGFNTRENRNMNLYRNSSDFSPLTVSNKFELLEDEGERDRKSEHEDTEDVYVTEIQPQKEFKFKKRVHNKDENIVNQQVDYINGNGSLPKEEFYNHSDRYQFVNKPVIKCRINGDSVVALMDSGASCNLISKSLFDIIQEKDKCEIRKTTNRITCANNSNLGCFGEVDLNFSLAGLTSAVRFYIVDGLRNFQSIIGLRTMKRLGIQFNFQRDCVVLNNIEIPFEFKTIPATTVVPKGNVKSLN